MTKFGMYTTSNDIEDVIVNDSPKGNHPNLIQQYRQVCSCCCCVDQVAMSFQLSFSHIYHQAIIE